jgi:hypothetical protein
MPAIDDLASFYDVANGEAELCTVQGVANVAGIFDTSSDIALGEAVVQAPTLRLPASVAAAADGACTVRGVAYAIRQVLVLPPDGAEQLLILARS